MSAKTVVRGFGVAVLLGLLGALYVATSAEGGDAAKAGGKDKAAADEKACGEGCWLPFF